MLWTAQFVVFSERSGNLLVKFQNILISFRYNFLDCWGGWWRWRLEGSDPELFSPPSSFYPWSAPKMWDQSTNHVIHLIQPIIIHQRQLFLDSVGPKSVTPRKQMISTLWSKYVLASIGLAIFIVQVQTDNEEKKSKNLVEQPACLEDAKEMKVKPSCLTSQLSVHLVQVVCKKTEEEMANNWVFLDCLDALPDNQSLSSKCETLVWGQIENWCWAIVDCSLQRSGTSSWASQSKSSS